MFSKFSGSRAVLRRCRVAVRKQTSHESPGNPIPPAPVPQGGEGRVDPICGPLPLGGVGLGVRGFRLEDRTVTK
jgi:hypothetical protein